MKLYEFKIDKFQASWVFAPIRERRDVASLLMKTIKIMLVDTPPLAQQVAGSIVLVVSKMSRVFFVSDRKVFSLAFPFFVNEGLGRLEFSTATYPLVDNRATSVVLELLDSPSMLTCADVLSFADPIHEASIVDDDIWHLVRELLVSEDGYVRYDFDPDREDGDRHPLNHLDIFYSSGSTFKLGLRNKTDVRYLTDILDTTTDCHYVTVAGKA